MDASLHICKATPADVGIISRIVERSIRLGCALDHRNDAQIVANWTHNKSAEHIQNWLADQRLHMSVAVLQDKPIGVGMAATNGQIAFCHVQPECFRRGAGQALMHDLEAWLRLQGLPAARLNSTVASEAFFRRLGYCVSAQTFNVAGLCAIPMLKTLVPPS
jgi:ribosomal protein S18 acetylase RimI-like enzyme